MAALWLADIESSIDARTLALYADTYVATHFAPFFSTNRIGSDGGRRGLHRVRLAPGDPRDREEGTFSPSPTREVGRTGEAYLSEMPENRDTRAACGGPCASLVPQAQPSWCSPRRRWKPSSPSCPSMRRASGPGSGSLFGRGSGSRGKAACGPQLFDKLSAPENYRVGASALRSRTKQTRAVLVAELPLSVKAREAFDVVCPVTGIIFGSHDFRTLLRPGSPAAASTLPRRTNSD